ncbi:tyrosine-type recombinase/integrase [Aneurinibacillus danicus]|uniref:Integrase n=1 Tax=Aneurinibacillus danicus TaxID=267746 RepID=A0A511VAH0_9BACL|nr:tyrosine-type recombinase/integrase [Aneurinibacillus danicus]GEN35926.1 integrase [Aneurinibacillus danicus]
MSNTMPWKIRNRHEIPVPKGVVNTGVYCNLIEQLNKLARHNRSLSFKSRDRYYKAVERFIRFLADNYQLQKLSNMSGRHVVTYIQYMQSKGLSASTIKTDVGAIRFFHDLMDTTRHPLPTNEELQEHYYITLEKRKFGGVDRVWSQKEFTGMIDYARTLKRHDIAHIAVLGREQGLRIHEAVRLDRAEAEKSLRTNLLTIKGKTGLIRHVPLRESARTVLAEVIQAVERGQKLFVPADKKAHQVIESVQRFIINHRDKFSEAGRDAPLTFHGLRHSFAREEYRKRIESGMNAHKARLEVSELLGHRRDDVTRIYLFEKTGEETE